MSTSLHRHLIQDQYGSHDSSGFFCHYSVRAIAFSSAIVNNIVLVIHTVAMVIASHEAEFAVGETGDSSSGS